MRTVIGLLASICLATCFADLRAEEFPYTAYVNAPNARLRSGPGTDHYATDRLRIGQPVEVFRKDPGDWLAIRPTDSSFSWARGSALLGTDDAEIAVATENDVVARVGSRFSQDQDISHVKLARGERVVLLEPEKFDEQEGKDVWVKIRPPAGEFRWISAKYVDRKPPVAEPKPGAIANRTPRGPAATRHPGWKNRKAIRLTAGEQPDPEADSSKGSKSSKSGNEDLATLELAVAKMLARPPRDWSFTTLREKVDKINRSEDDTRTKTEAQRLLRRIDRYAGLKARFKGEAPRHIGEKVEEPKSKPLVSASTPKIDDTALFDFAGRLVPVVSRSRRPDAPKFALTDAKGKVVCFLAESTAVALKDYVDKHVAVSGPKTHLGRLQKDQVEVRRIAQKDPIAVPAGQIVRRPRTDATRQ